MFAPLYYPYALFLFSSLASAFSFTTSTISECDTFSVEWTGGTGPYQLLIVPPFGTPRNISIPSSAYTNGKGSFSTRMEVPKDRQVVLTMSDSTGFGAGGSTNVLTVGESNGGSCNSTDPGVDFNFQINFALQQCRNFIFEEFGKDAVLPVTARIVVPGGTATAIQVPVGSSRFSWVANIPAGTSAIFMMTDARGRQGGASNIRTVELSDDRSCLNDHALSSTVTFVTSSATGRPPQSSAESAPTASTSGVSDHVPISAIAGTVIGSLLFLAVIVTLGLFFLKNFKKKRDRLKDAKRRATDNGYHDQGGSDPYGLSAVRRSYGPSSTALASENPFADSHNNGHPLSGHPNASTSTIPAPLDSLLPRTHYPPSPMPTPFSADPFNPSAPPVLPVLGFGDSYPISPIEESSTQGTSSSAQKDKATMAGISAYPPQRFIVHTDVEDEIPPPNADGVVELPPVYTERRGPSNFVVINADPPSPRSPNAHPYAPPSNNSSGNPFS